MTSSLSAVRAKQNETDTARATERGILSATATDVAAIIGGGQRVRLLIVDATGAEFRPIVDRTSVQRFGGLDLLTFHAPGMPDSVGVLSKSQKGVVCYELV
jgi:hypothetical protein